MENSAYSGENYQDFISFLRGGYGSHVGAYPIVDDIDQAARHLVESTADEEGLIDHADTLIENDDGSDSNDHVDLDDHLDVDILEKNVLAGILMEKSSNKSTNTHLQQTTTESAFPQTAKEQYGEVFHDPNHIMENEKGSSIDQERITIHSILTNSFDQTNIQGLSANNGMWFNTEMLSDNPPHQTISPQGHSHLQWQQSRCVEEDYCIVLQRNLSASAKSSNTKYRCKFCDFEFVGGPQKIRVHLTGKSENRTRLSKCTQVPEHVKVFMESRNKSRNVKTSAFRHDNNEVKDSSHPTDNSNTDVGAINDSNIVDGPRTSTDPLAPRNWEEYHCIVLSRASNPKSKNANSRYQCRYCSTQFVGGPQKIRVHLSGEREGTTQLAKCVSAPPALLQTLQWRKRNRQAEKTAKQLMQFDLLQESSPSTAMNSNIGMEESSLLHLLNPNNNLNNNHTDTDDTSDAHQQGAIGNGNGVGVLSNLTFETNQSSMKLPPLPPLDITSVATTVLFHPSLPTSSSRSAVNDVTDMMLTNDISPVGVHFYFTT